MAELKDIIKIGIAVFAIVLLGLMLAGFYFTVVSSPGQQFLIGGFEQVAATVFQAVSAPFIAIYKFIIGIPAKLGFYILGVVA